MNSEDPSAEVDPSTIKIEDTEEPAVDSAPAEAAAEATTPAAEESTTLHEPSSPASSSLLSSMRTEVPSGTWEEQWEVHKERIHGVNPPLTTVVSNPEKISSFMST